MPVAPPFEAPVIAPNYWSFSTLSLNRSTRYPNNQDYWAVFPNDIRVFDINGDGHLDVLQIYSYIPDRDMPGIPLRVLLGDGHGHFTDASDTIFSGGMPLGNAATGVSVADFNGDGVKDVFVSVTWETPSPKEAHNLLLLSDGHGGVINASATLPNINDYSHWSSAGDVDGDGDIDIFVDNIAGATNAPGGDTSSYFLINDGLGHFTRADDRLPTLIENGNRQYTSSLLFDADRDGDADLLLGMWGPQAALFNSGALASLILFNDGAGHFAQTANSTMPAPLFAVDKAEVLGTQATDLNGDGYLDLLMLMHNQHDRAIQVLINNGNGTFRDETAARLHASITDPRETGRYLHLVDVNADGNLDLVLQTGGPNRFYLNDGTGHFVALPGDFLFTNSPDGNYAFVPGDFDEDGRQDFFVRTFVNSWDDPSNATEFDWVVLWRQPAGATLTGNEAANAVLGTGANEILSGLGGDDVIFGGKGSDVLIGGTGADTMLGGAGADTLDGGANADIFAFGPLSDSRLGALRSDGAKIRPDIIRDFVSGEDRIDLSAMDANRATGTDDAFTFIGAAAFSGQAGQLRCDFTGGFMHIFGDVDGDGRADFEIVAATPVLQATDFIL